MANEYLDEYEQSEAAKKWLRENGPALVVGVLLGVGGIFGYKYWQGHQQSQAVQAAVDYQSLVGELDADSEATIDDLNVYRDEHGDHAYTGFLALQLAAKAVEQNNYEEAIGLLEQAAGIAEPKPLRTVASLRLARVYLQTGQLDKAQSALDQNSDERFSVLRSSILGDILAARGDSSGARAAYQEALDNLEASGGGDRNLLEMKLNDLAETYTAENS